LSNLETVALDEETALDREMLLHELCTATQEVFSTMLGLEVVPGEAFNQKNVVGSADGVMSLIGLAGPWTGAGSVICSPECACKMACCLLMTEYPAVDNEVLDAVAEVTNMVIGNFKTLIEPRTGPLGLSIPSVVYGRNFTIRNGVNDEWTVMPFYCGEQQFEIRVCLMRSRGSGRPLMAAAV
jgi:chemotaxis protein CheX